MPSPARPLDEPVSELTTARLSMYLRVLEALHRDRVETVSSTTLADQCQVHAALIRRDLACFGEFGVRGVGYRVAELRQHLRQILGLDRGLRVVIIGAGNLGLALADYPGFREDGFDVIALLDVAPDKVGGHSRTGIPIRHLDDLPGLAARERASIAVVAVPSEAAQTVATRAVEAGIRAILNFAPCALRVPEGVKVKHIDLSVPLETLSFFLAQQHQHG